jgi:hypothetical protein
VQLKDITWAEEVGFPYSVIKARLRLGWTVERALTEPPRVKPGAGPRRTMPGTATIREERTDAPR